MASVTRLQRDLTLASVLFPGGDVDSLGTDDSSTIHGADYLDAVRPHVHWPWSCRKSFVSLCKIKPQGMQLQSTFVKGGLWH